MKNAAKRQSELSRPAAPESEWPVLVEKAALEILASLVRRAPLASRPMGDRDGGVISAVGSASSLAGKLTISCPVELARRLACRMLGLPAPSEEQIRLSLGEIAHRITRKLATDSPHPGQPSSLPASAMLCEADELEWLGEEKSYLAGLEFEGFPLWVRLSLEI